MKDIHKFSFPDNSSEPKISAFILQCFVNTKAFAIFTAKL